MTPSLTKPCISVQSLSKRFGKTQALDDLSFSAQEGQIIGLLGRNGAGKSTLLRIVSAQLKPDSGKAELFGQKVTGTAALKDFCMIGDFPDFGKLPNIKSLLAVCQGLFPCWDREYAMELVQRFDLPLKKKLKGFSRGMQTALLLTVGLASGARLTVFDEPSLGLDAVMRERFYDQLLEERKKNAGRTFIISTHLIDEVCRTLDYGIMIDAGKLLFEGDLSDLTSHYISVSGAPEAVREVTAPFILMKEEEMAGSLVHHVKLRNPEDTEAVKADNRVQFAPLSLQRIFVFLTEKEEENRHAANA